MRISDWSSDVCSSDLVRLRIAREQQTARGVTVEPMYGKRPALETETQAVEMILEAQAAVARRIDRQAIGLVADEGIAIEEQDKIGRASCRATGCKDMEIWGVAGQLKKKTIKNTQK